MINRPSIFDPTPVSASDKSLSILSHLSGLFGFGIVLPFIVYLVMKKDSDFAANNAREALCFQISMLVYLTCSTVLAMAYTVLWLWFFVAFGICYLVFSIIACVKTSNGQCYHYPLTLQFLRSMEVGRVI